MGYADYLIDLLRPLGVYDLRPDSFSGAELQALGAALDQAQTAQETLLREMVLATAQAEGLERYEALLRDRPQAGTVSGRRAALAALLRMGGSTLAQLNEALAGCGTAAKVEQTNTYGTLLVSFPGQMGIPEGIDRLKASIEGILPCHLATTYFYRYLYWSDTQALALTWADLEGLRWDEAEQYDIYAG